MVAIIDAWREDHKNFAKLLDMLEEQVRVFHDAQTPNYELMLDIMYYMTHYPDAFHHPKEDLVFAKVAEIDPGERAAVQELMEQHVVLKQSGIRLLEELQGVVDGAMRPRGSIEEPAQMYIRYFRNHMHNEESELLPLALQYLQDEHWAAVEAVAPSRADPLFGAEEVEKRYEALHRRILGSADG